MSVDKVLAIYYTTKKMMNDEIMIGETIRRLRIHKGLPLEEVAAKANLSPVSVRALELGRGSTLGTMLKVLRALDETRFISDWAGKSREQSPLKALRASRDLSAEPKRVSRRSRNSE